MSHLYCQRAMALGLPHGAQVFENNQWPNKVSRFCVPRRAPWAVRGVYGTHTAPHAEYGRFTLGTHGAWAGCGDAQGRRTGRPVPRGLRDGGGGGRGDIPGAFAGASA